MHRECSHCQRPFTPKDFVKEESKGMEGERKAMGLTGVRFLYYTCPECGFHDIFVEIHPLADESPADFQKRRAELEATVKQIHGDHVEVVLSQRQHW